MNTVEDRNTAELARHTQTAAEELFRSELATIRHELRTEIRDMQSVIAAYGVAAVAGLLGTQTLMTSASAAHPKRGIAIGTLALLVSAGALLVAGGTRKQLQERVARRQRTFSPS